MKRQLYFLSSLALIAASLALTLGSCGSGTEEHSGENKDTMSVDTVAGQEKKENIFYSMPSPLQLGKMLQKSGATFDKTILNPVANVANYSTATSRALNLGVFSADLSYAAVFNQSQEVMSYLDASKKLGDGLGSSAAFSENTMKRLKDNVGKKDSTLSIISEIFLTSNETFKENEQQDVYILALAGGFTEGLYLGTQAAKKIKNNEGIITRIAELKGAIGNLLMMLNQLDADETIKSIISDIQEINSVYQEMPTPEKSITSVSSDTTKKTGTIGGNSKYTLTKDQLEKITARAESLRSKITK